MPKTQVSRTGEILKDSESEVLKSWVKELLKISGGRQINESELRRQCAEFLSSFRECMMSGADTIESSEWESVKTFLNELCLIRAEQRFSPSETAQFIFSLKQPLFSILVDSMKGRPQELVDEIWSLTELLDELGLYATEQYQRAKEEIINRQQQDILEVSTPVIQIWPGVVALPIIGTLDSERSQIMMERLLQTLSSTGCTVAILDISGVPAVDTMVAQHLIKTIQAAKIMGAQCIISGIRPEIAQTIVHLGVDLSMVRTKATMSRALEEALQMVNLQIVPRGQFKQS